MVPHGHVVRQTGGTRCRLHLVGLFGGQRVVKRHESARGVGVAGLNIVGGNRLPKMALPGKRGAILLPRCRVESARLQHQCFFSRASGECHVAICRAAARLRLVRRGANHRPPLHNSHHRLCRLDRLTADSAGASMAA